MPTCKECHEFVSAIRCEQLKDGVCAKCMAKRVEPVDLRPITRYTDKVVTRVYLCDEFGHHQRVWITLGQCKLMRPIERNNMRWWLGAYLTEGVTDFEHDSAYALRLPLLALSFEMLEMGMAWFHAIIDPNNADDFCVPPPGYNPMEHTEAYDCEECRKRKGAEPHMIVPENFFVPPRDPKLHAKVACRHVLITIGVVHEETE
jgi:hypothetical protein